jgi:phosphonopyruvate decarboxylase
MAQGLVMTAPEAFVASLDKQRFDFFTGVPCSYLGGPLSLLTEEGRYRPAVNEGAALALAAGATAGGARSVVFAQNSGLGNLINPLTSLLLPYRIPVLIVMSLRGWPDPNGDEPQHRVMGTSTHALFDTVGVPHRTLDGPGSDVDTALQELSEALTDGLPAALLVAKRSVSGAPVSPVRGLPAVDRPAGTGGSAPGGGRRFA